MSFRVDPESVARFGRVVGDLRDDARVAGEYAGEHLAVRPEQSGLFLQVIQTAEQVRSLLERNYQQLYGVVDESAAELHSTAALYRTVDDGEAARLDATY